MRNFLDFVNKKDNYKKNISMFNEAFKTSDVSKSLELITQLFKKNISNTVAMDPNPTPTISGGKDCMSYYWFYYKDGKLDMMWSFNYLVNGNSAQVYSIDFYTGTNAFNFWMNRTGVKTNISIFTLGTSIAYFLPICYHIVNNHDFSLDNKKAASLGNTIFKESKFYVGACEYKVYENLSKQVIYDAFNIKVNEESEAQKYRWELRDKKNAAYNKKVKTKDPADIANFEKLRDEYDAVVAAIKGGARTINEIEFAIKGGVQTSVKLPEADAAQTEIEEEHDSPELAFKKMSKYISLVVKGLQPSLIICGAPGVGKTYNVIKQLKASGYIENHNMFTIKGKCTPSTLYKTLYQFQDKNDIVLIDDADGLVGPKAPEDCINILKAALDSTSDDEGRLVSYGISGKILDDEGDPIPKRFYYRGAVIVLTNYQAGALNTALRGRSYIQDMVFTVKDILDRIKSLMPELEKQSIGMKAKIKAYDYLQELLESGAPMVLSMRGFVLCAKMFQAAEGDADWDDETCKQMIREQMKHQAARGNSHSTY